MRAAIIVEVFPFGQFLVQVHIIAETQQLMVARHLLLVESSGYLPFFSVLGKTVEPVPLEHVVSARVRYFDAMIAILVPCDPDRP